MTQSDMPTSSSGPLTMLARSMGQRPPPAPGAVSYRLPNPPRHHAKEPSSKRCSSESRCPVDNLLRIGPSFATWEDPRLTDNPRRMQVTWLMCVCCRCISAAHPCRAGGVALVFLCRVLAPTVRWVGSYW